VAKETRKLKRNAQREQKLTGKEKRAQMNQPLSLGEAQEAPDPFSPQAIKSTVIRVGLILGAVWLVGGLIAGMSQSTLTSRIALAVPAVISLVVIGVLIWTVRRTRSAREVANVLKGAETAEDRKAAIEKLSSGKKADPAKIFAQAQLEMQEDPKKALETLERIDLSKVMAAVADEARSQRAMIHLTMGQVNLARQLVDNIELKRHQDVRSRAMMGAIAAETWARSGEGKKAITTLNLFDLADEQLVQITPQLLRSYAFAYAHTTKTKELKRTLRQMLKIDARLLGGFLQGKGHPLLQKEARKMLEQSGAVPRKMQVQRMR
jgi:hypothetical protein